MTPDDKGKTGDSARDILTPSFIVWKDEGIFVHLPKLQLASEFEQFVTRVFGAELFFRNLEYAAFHKLLYDDEWLRSVQSQQLELKLASDILHFPPERRPLYHAVKLAEGGQTAEYMFEPVSLEVSDEEPVFGEPDESGNPTIVEYRTRTRLKPDKLDFDEFIADMWMKEVRFGLDADTIRKKISGNVTERCIIAHQLDPSEGHDAEIREASDHLHRDNSPKVLATGKADLRAFKNRFPQMAEGERIIQKIPRKLGKSGRKISGEAIEPRLPKDIDLSVLASLGTRIEQARDGEYIVAAMNGFLSYDSHTNHVSITEKIENKGGISVKTTGNLDLSVGEFIEHGEVQEGRHVEGKHMTFLSGVFGNALSHSGNILIKSNLTGGKAVALDGNVEVAGKTSRADVRSSKGEVIVGHAESSTLLGKIVRVKHAVNCEIVADELHAEQLEGCRVAAKQVTIAGTGERRGVETLVTVLIPDYSPVDQTITETKKQAEEMRNKIASLKDGIQALRANADFSKFLALEASIKRGAVKLNDDQHANWIKLVEKHAASTNQLSAMQSAIATLEQQLQDNGTKLDAAEQERETMGAGINCTITHVQGQTIGQTMKTGKGLDAFTALAGNDIKALLQKIDSSKSRIFSGDSGTIQWQFKPPKGNY